MKVFLGVPHGLSRAMNRVANALEKYRPDWVQIVTNPAQAEFRVLHVIGADAIPFAQKLTVPYAVMQYCTGSAARGDLSAWDSLWNSPLCDQVWSYYNLNPWVLVKDKRFYHAPLGIDTVFRKLRAESDRDIDLLTSGYVNARGQEAIEPIVDAMHAVNHNYGCEANCIHLGPQTIEGLHHPPLKATRVSPTDDDLADLYRRTFYVGALRYVEGFEMGAAEGLAGGARPVMFDRDEARRWFDGLAAFVPETDNPEQLTASLEALFEHGNPVVTLEERALALERFNWKTLVPAFWARVKENL